jgi:hypothetical protein
LLGCAWLCLALLWLCLAVLGLEKQAALGNTLPCLRRTVRLTDGRTDGGRSARTG